MSGNALISNFMCVVWRYCGCYTCGTEESADMTKLLCVFCRCFSTSTTKINACRNFHPSACKTGTVPVCHLPIRVVPKRRCTLKMEVPGFYETLAPIYQSILQHCFCLGCDTMCSGGSVQRQTTEERNVNCGPSPYTVLLIYRSEKWLHTGCVYWLDCDTSNDRMRVWRQTRCPKMWNTLL